MELQVDSAPPGIRLDAWLHRQLPQLSRSLLARWIREGRVLVDGRRAKPRHALAAGQVVRVAPPPPPEPVLRPREMDLDILHEDSHLLVLDKKPGVMVHPGSGRGGSTLVDGLLHHCGGELAPTGDPLRPGIVHRLDQDTSGCLVVAKTAGAHRDLSRQFAGRSVAKRYLALACGRVVPAEGSIEAGIERNPARRDRMRASRQGGGRPALTRYRTLEPLEGASLLELDLHTGRTHQIRAHLQFLGFPVFGDESYGRRSTAALARQCGHRPARQMLHARFLAFGHPATREPMRFQAPAPPDFLEALRALGGNRALQEQPSWTTPG